jgi:dihydroorotase/N-acyl-D-amino-acid deacylase
LAGKTLADIAVLRGLTPTTENAAETAIWLTERGGCQEVFHAINRRDLVRILQHPATMVASDGEIPTPGAASRTRGR